MKRGSSGRLKETINALCRVLSIPGGSQSPETFRQAKFNHAQTTAEFWKLLWSLLKQIYVEESTVVGNDSENTDAQIWFVKSVLWYYGYGAPEFYQLPQDGSHGSRELLLAFSWLLHKIHLVEKLLEVKKVKMGDEISVCTCPRCLPAGPRRCEDIPTPKDGVDIRYLQWLNGKLQFSWRALHATQQEKCAALYKIHSSTEGCHPNPLVGHFSVTEADLTQQPEKYTELLELMESENGRLEAYLAWKDLEPVYWQWMESVFKSKVEDARSLQLQDADNRNTGLPITDSCPRIHRSIKDIDKLTGEFVELHNNLQELVTCKRASWKEKIKEKEKELLNNAHFHLAIKKIRKQVEKDAESLNHSSAHGISEMHGSYRLVFKDLPNSVKRGIPGLGYKDPSLKTLCAKDVISVLQTKGNAVEKELKLLQEECRSKLEAMAEGFEGVVCIPPPKR
ncbi:tubulin epsilon and delta complex protein 1 [Ambystoma mexicanum]|uniref:tubulin epsilon and delta complex protein 1 n=1 Tax=Ambystoma mexicanum TaxID=8296 RepID=UPI0037E74E1F